jgi:hypothetical protein
MNDSLNVDSVLVSLFQSGKINYYGWNDTPAWREMLSSGRIIPLRIDGQVYYIDNVQFNPPRLVFSSDRFADSLLAAFPDGYPIRTQSTVPVEISPAQIKAPTWEEIPGTPVNPANKAVDLFIDCGIFIAAAFYIVLVYLKISLAFRPRHEPGTS